MLKKKHDVMKTKSRSWKASRLIGPVLASAAICCHGQDLAANGAPKTASSDISEASLDELMNYKITSVSRNEQPYFTAAAAVHVITQEDIRRSGATTIAEALRMAPGLDVARIDSSRWAISSRGFNDFFANKLLVLMDGRSVYTPLFSGVFWDVQDTALQDIERIEVIRGPGATLWGANAVNGVINIITKNSKDTQGGYIEAGGGSEDRAFSTIRYGGKISEDAYYRVYAKYVNRDETPFWGGAKGNDDWDMWRAGFRSDWAATEFNDFTFQGDVYTGTLGQALYVFPPPTYFETLAGDGTVEGGNFLTSWSHRFSSESDFKLQLYYDRTDREDRVHHETRDTYDLDFQQRFAFLPRQEILVGGGYRYTRDNLADGLDNSGGIVFNPDRRGDQLFSAFVQDQISVVQDKLDLTLGSKFENNDYTGFEAQPNARLALMPNEKNTIWAAVSRAVRTPSRFEHTINLWFNPPSLLTGNPDYRSEELIAYELGYRVKPLKTVSFDLALFYNDYDRLRAVSPYGTLGPLPLFHIVNEMQGETYGGELGANWNVTPEWRLSASYTLLQMQLHSQIPFSDAIEGESPENQFQVRSYLDLTHHVQFDTALYYVDNLSARSIPSYFKLDARIGWQPINNLDLSIVFQNILDSSHPEFGNGFLTAPSHEIDRSIYGKVTWRF
jgi:iron complex outermembrane receptor protein